MINPVLLGQNIPPEVAAAVSSTIVLFTSMSTTSQFIVAGAFDLNFAVYIIAVSAVGSVIGNFVLKRVLAYYDKPSIVVWILFVLLGLSGIILPILGGLKIL